MTDESSGQVIWTPCYVALGSNLNEPIKQLNQAFIELSNITATRLIACSSLYESLPMGPQDQPVFINAVASLLTQLNPIKLLLALKTIEQRMGREASGIHWGPRVIDLDLLMHGDTHCDSNDLKLPHPGMLQRNFVMAPLAEIAPELKVGKSSAAYIAQKLGGQGLQRLPK